MQKPYTSPTVTVVGSVHEITQQDKEFGGSDGLTFEGVPIRNAS
jgi:hypothetical protein